MHTNPTQRERVRMKLHRDGAITRNQCLSQRPAIARLAARIIELEAEGYVFETRNIGGDYAYRLVSIKGVPFRRQEQMALTV